MTVLFFVALAVVISAIIYGFVKRTPVKKVEATYAPIEAPTQVGSDPVFLDQPEQEKPVLLSDEDLWPLVPAPEVPVAEPAKEDPVVAIVQPEVEVKEEEVKPPTKPKKVFETEAKKTSAKPKQAKNKNKQ